MYFVNVLQFAGSYNSQLLSSCVAYLLNRAVTEVQIERLVEITRSLKDMKFFSYAFCLALQYNSIENVTVTEDMNWSLVLWKNISTLLKLVLAVVEELTFHVYSRCTDTVS